MLGLFIGKQLGVFGFSWLAIKSGYASLPTDSNWKQLYGVSILTGIGFTMSLFVDTLAYNDTQIYHYADKLAILLGSFVSGLVGYLVLRMSK
jgi:NhaA family Na+:H+ antiporter